jgi:hypothetical protein
MRPPVWLVAIAAVLLVIFAIVEMGGGPAATPYGAFLDQLDAGNVASVTFRGTEIDGRFKHPVGDAVSNGRPQRETFRSQVPDFGDSALIAALHKQRVAIDVTSPPPWMSWLGRLPWPLLVFLGVILVAGLIRLARGGKAHTGPAMPMHPMQGMLGLVSGLFGKNQQAASEPTQAGEKTKGS